MFDVFESPWWERGWLYQEFMCANQAYFLYGRGSISWTELSLILDSYMSCSRYFATDGEVFLRKNKDFARQGVEYRRLSRIRQRADRAVRAEGLVALMVENKIRWSGNADLI